MWFYSVGPSTVPNRETGTGNDCYHRPKKKKKHTHIPRQFAFPLSLQGARETVICVCDCQNSVLLVLLLFQKQHLWSRSSVTTEEGGSRLQFCLCFSSFLFLLCFFFHSNPTHEPQKVIITAGYCRRGRVPSTFRRCPHKRIARGSEETQVSAVRNGSHHFDQLSLAVSLSFVAVLYCYAGVTIIVPSASAVSSHDKEQLHTHWLVKTLLRATIGTMAGCKSLVV